MSILLASLETFRILGCLCEYWSDFVVLFAFDCSPPRSLSTMLDLARADYFVHLTPEEGGSWSLHFAFDTED